jgi:hypothetical protein
METKPVSCLRVCKPGNKPDVCSMLELLHYWLHSQDGWKVSANFGAWLKSVFDGVAGVSITEANHRGMFLCTHRESVLAESFMNFLVSQRDAGHRYMKLFREGDRSVLNPFAVTGLLYAFSAAAGGKKARAPAVSFFWYKGGDSTDRLKLSALDAVDVANVFLDGEWCTNNREGPMVPDLKTFFGSYGNTFEPGGNIRLVYAESRHPVVRRRPPRGKAEKDADFVGSEEDSSSGEESADGGVDPDHARKRSRKKDRRADERAHDPLRWMALARLVQPQEPVASAAGGARASTTGVTVADQRAILEEAVRRLKKEKGRAGADTGKLDADIAYIEYQVQKLPEDPDAVMACLRNPLDQDKARLERRRDVIEGFDPNGLTLKDQFGVAIAIMKNLQKVSPSCYFADALDELGLVLAPPQRPAPVQRSPSPPAAEPEVDPAVLAVCGGVEAQVQFLCDQFAEAIKSLPIPVPESESHLPPPARNPRCTYDYSQFPRVLTMMLGAVKPAFKREHKLFQLVQEGFCHCDFLVWLFLRRVARIGGKNSDALEKKAVFALQHMVKFTLPLVRSAGYAYLESGGLFDPVERKFQPLSLCPTFKQRQFTGEQVDKYEDLVTARTDDLNCSLALARRLVFDELAQKSADFKEWNARMVERASLARCFQGGPLIEGFLAPAPVAPALAVPEGFDGIRPEETEDYIMLHRKPIEDFFQSLDESRSSVALHNPGPSMPKNVPRAV